jgi:AraC-like DNA-binding protein
MSSDEPDFKKLYYKSPETYDRSWLEWFREEFGRQVYRVDMQPNPDVPFKMTATTRVLPELAISASACSPMRSAHPQYLIADDDLVLVVVQAGDMSFQCDGHDVTPPIGMASAACQDIPSVVELRSHSALLSFRLKRKLIEPLIKDFSGGALRTIPPGSQALRLLLGYVRMLDGEETLDTPEARRLVTTHVHDLVALVLGATDDAGAAAADGGVRVARLAAIKSDILDDLARADLSVAGMAARHGVTPRYLHMLFEAEGVTFSEYVLSQRLARVHRMLGDPRLGHQSIAAIALMVGFGDLSYFNRTFRRRFGMTPSDVRERARREGGG